MENPCKWHEVPVKDCLSCNPTPSNAYYIRSKPTDGELYNELECMEHMLLNMFNSEETSSED